MRKKILTRQALAVTPLDLSTAANSGKVSLHDDHLAESHWPSVLSVYSSRNKSLNEPRSISTGKPVIFKISRHAFLLVQSTTPHHTWQLKIIIQK